MEQEPAQRGFVTTRDQFHADLTEGDWSCPQFLARLAAEAGPDLMVVTDPLARVRYASTAAARMLGYEPSEKSVAHILHYVHPDDATSVLSALRSAGGMGRYHEPVAVRIRNAHDQWVDCDVNAVAIEGPDGYWTVLALRGMTDRTEVQDRRVDLGRLIHRASLECAHARWFDCDEIVEHLTRRLAGILGASLVELAWTEKPHDEPMRAGIHWAARSDDRWSEPVREPNEVFEPFSSEESAESIVVHRRDLPEAAGAWSRAGYESAGLDCAVEILVSPTSPRAMIRLGFADGGRQWRAIHAEAVGDIALILMSTLRRCEAERQLEERARLDCLTGLVNREELYRRLSEAIGRAGSGSQSVGVIYGDLDRFKVVNDKFGHAIGDGVLRSVADVLADALRDGDFAARSGGDEFVVVCNGLRSPREIQAVADRIQTGVSSLTVDGHRMRISVGCAVNDGSTTADDLVGRADANMYANKRRAAMRMESARSVR